MLRYRMVTDRLLNAELYRSLSPRIAAAFDYVARTPSLVDGIVVTRTKTLAAQGNAICNLTVGDFDAKLFVAELFATE